MRRRSFLSALFAAGVAGSLLVPAGPAAGQAPKKGSAPEDVSFDSADGVKLNARFWKQLTGTRGPVIMLLPAFKADPTKGWDDLGSELSAANYNVLRLEYRGHGKSLDINHKQFFQDTVYLSAINQKMIKGAEKPNKVAISKDDFRAGYSPMLVNDIMAARAYLDKKNDEGLVNTSSVYLIGAGDAATLGFLYMTAEWKREAKYNVVVPQAVIRATSPIRSNADPAAKDIAGAIWLSPTQLISSERSRLPKTNIQSWARLIAPNLRDETPMLFLHGQDEQNGLTDSRFFFSDVLRAETKSSEIKPLQQTFGPFEKTENKDKLKKVEFPKTKLSGAALLGNDEKFKVETQIKAFLKSVQDERKNKAPIDRQQPKPLPIDLGSFGANLAGG